MSSNWQALADKFVHDLENKGYELVDKAATVAEEALEAVISVAEDAQGRVQDLREQYFPVVDNFNGADFWDNFTDKVFDAAAKAPVAEEESLEEKARKAYEWMTSQEKGPYSDEPYPRYWEKFYASDGPGNLKHDTWWRGLVNTATREGYKP